MRKYSTIHEENEKRWEKEDLFKREDKTKTFGKRNKCEFQDWILIPHFCSTGLCNLWHVDDMAKVMWDINVPFEVNWWMRKGRDHCCQITIKNKHCVEVFATGYGTGETIQFNKGFPPKLKFQIMREMARDTTWSLFSYNLEYKNYIEIYRQGAICSLIVNHARNVKDLFKIAEIYHKHYNKGLYDKWSKECRQRIKEGKAWDSPLWKDKDMLKKIRKFNKKWREFIKSDFYNLFKKYFKEEKKRKFEKDKSRVR